MPRRRPETKPLLSPARIAELKAFGEGLVDLCRRYRFEVRGPRYGSGFVEVHDALAAPLPDGGTYVAWFKNVDGEMFCDLEHDGVTKTRAPGIEVEVWTKFGPGDTWEGPKDA